MFDNIAEWETAINLKAAKGKQGNPFHDVNEVHRLIYQVTTYYRPLLINMIENSQSELNWTARGCKRESLGTTAQQSAAADALHRPLRSRFPARLSRSVGLQEA